MRKDMSSVNILYHAKVMKSVNFNGSLFIFFCKQKTAYEMRISDWSSDVCSSDLLHDGSEELLADLRVGGVGDRVHLCASGFRRRAIGRADVDGDRKSVV